MTPRHGAVVAGCAALALLAALPELAPHGAPSQPDTQAPQFRVLLFSKTAGYRHDAIPAAVAAIRALGAQHGFAVDVTEDAAAFSDASLPQYAAVVFLLTSGDVLDTAQQAAFTRYIQAGGGYAGIHSASDTEFDWPWYGALVGAYFQDHPSGLHDAIIVREVADHPSTAPLPATWARRDEWYNFRSNPRAQVTVLLRLDEASYSGGTMGKDHPIAWYHSYDGGRAWYSAGGHSAASYEEPLFLAHILGGIRYAAGVAPAQPPTATPTPSATPTATATATAQNSSTPTATPAAGPPPRLWLPLAAG